ncbi:MAG: class B sortase [Defluviitaleaceae bacterium]|nr:class B sortase [Defluviitaleaceae bacterium]
MEKENSQELENQKTPWVTVIILAVISCASLTTGIVYWYNTYLRPVEYVQPAVLALAEDADEDGEAGEYEPYDEGTSILPVRPVVDPLPEFVALWAEYGNENIVARLSIADMEILVVQAEDNSFYLEHGLRGEPSLYGWVFLDYEVDLLMGEDFNMVIHLPHSSAHSQLGALRHVLQAYMDYYFFLAHPTISLATLYGDFDWEIFSFYVAPSDFPFAVVNHPDYDTWGDVVEQFTLVSMYNTMLDVTPYDQVLTITTPTDISPDLFYVLQARLLRQITS